MCPAISSGTCKVWVNSLRQRGGQSPRLAAVARERAMAAGKSSAGDGPADTPVTLDDIEAARGAAARRDRRDRLRLEPHAVRDPGLQDLAQVREPAVHGLVQGARRAQPAVRPVGGGAQARRDRHVGRQPRAGRRLSREPAVDTLHHRHARQHADREGGQHAPARRRGDPARARRWRRPPPLRGSTAASAA